MPAIRTAVTLRPQHLVRSGIMINGPVGGGIVVVVVVVVSGSGEPQCSEAVLHCTDNTLTRVC